MAEEKKQSKSLLLISKQAGYKELNILLSSYGIDKAREKKFNDMKKIEVTSGELTKIGEHRWLQNN